MILNNMKNIILLIMQCFLLSGISSAADSDLKPSIGVFYYPGWKDNVLGNRSPTPWQDLKTFPGREPLSGYYNEGDVDLMESQLGLMGKAGIDNVVFDWYWNHKLGALQTHALAAYFQAQNPAKIKFSILWANHTEFPESVSEFEKMVRFWVYYFRRSDYLQVDGMPVVYVFSTAQLEERALRFGSDTATLLANARQIARAAGFQGIYFIGGAGANSPTVKKYNNPALNGYNAFSAYNYHGPGTFRYAGGHSESHSFAELDMGYRDHWQWMLKNNTYASYIIPMTAGWDHRPWGPSKDPLHDFSMPTPDQFEAHIRAARELMLKQPQVTRKMGVICCWNEFGEGSYLEPTKGSGDALLQRVKRVFGQ